MPEGKKKEKEKEKEKETPKPFVKTVTGGRVEIKAVEVPKPTAPTVAAPKPVPTKKPLHCVQYHMDGVGYTCYEREDDVAIAKKKVAERLASQYKGCEVKIR